MIDTPGFGDSNNDDDLLIEEMMDILANVVDHTDSFLLLFDGRETRFDASLQDMIKKMTIIFGHNWWDYLVIGVSFWDMTKTQSKKDSAIQSIQSTAKTNLGSVAK